MGILRFFVCLFLLLISSVTSASDQIDIGFPDSNNFNSTPIGFSDVTTHQDFEFEGIGCEISISYYAGVYDSCQTPSDSNNVQSVYVSSSDTLNSQKSLTVSYKSSDPTTTGLSFRIHFNSSALTLNDIANTYMGDAYFLPSIEAVEADLADLDNNPDTDSYIVAAWSSIFGMWPGSSSVDLMTLTLILFNMRYLLQMSL